MRVVVSKSGAPTLALGDRYLHSAYDPVREARREVEALVPDNPSLVVILGMGLAYAVDAALELMPGAQILVIESSEEIHRLAAETRALPDDPRVTWIIGKHADANFEALTYTIDAVAAVGTRYLTRLAALNDDPDAAAYYARVVDTIGRIAAMHVEGLRSMAQWGPLWWENSVRNAREWATRPDVGGWFGPALGKGQAVFVFAAGPTLSDHLDRFVGQEGGIRFVVDTAYETVRRAGVRVDVVFAVDAQAQTLAHFAHARPACLVAAPVVPPSLWGMAGDALLTSLDGPHFAWWDRALGRPVARLKSGGSVTTFAFDLARRMNPDAVVLVGADFAHRGSRRHVGGTAYETGDVARVARFLPLERLARREAFRHAGHATEPVLAQYAQWMLWEIHATRCPVYRMSDFGLLAGVPVAAPSNLDPWLAAPAPSLRVPRSRLGDIKPLWSALADERRALGKALEGSDEHLAALSGFFDLLVRPWAVASMREGFSGEARDALRGALATAASVLDDVLDRRDGPERA